MTADPYAATESETTQGKVYTVTGQDWDSIVTGIAEDHDDIEVYSPESPLGATLLGHKAGETVDFEQPNGKVAKIEIISAVPFDA